VVRLIEEGTGLAPRALLVSPVREFGPHYREGVGAYLRIAQQLHGTSDRLEHVLEVSVVHPCSNSSRRPLWPRH
jgi:hypothetical protein